MKSIKRGKRRRRRGNSEQVLCYECCRGHSEEKMETQVNEKRRDREDIERIRVWA